MEWNSESLNKIQSIENDLINNKKGSTSSIFTFFIHNTDLWIDEKNEKEVLEYYHIERLVIPEGKAYKKHFITPYCMKDITDNIAKFIELGSNLNVACTLAGYNYNVLRTKFTIEHKEKFKRSRELKYSINQ